MHVTQDTNWEDRPVWLLIAGRKALGLDEHIVMLDTDIADVKHECSIFRTPNVTSSQGG